MKKKLLILGACIILLFSSCSIRGELPDSGIWYCEELKISIDFTKFHQGNNECAYFYNEDGSYELYKCLIDYGTTIGISSADEEDLYYIGNFNFKEDTFIIITFDGKEYAFRQSKTQEHKGTVSVKT